jgi:hypothetical protein
VRVIAAEVGSPVEEHSVMLRRRGVRNGLGEVDRYRAETYRRPTSRQLRIHVDGGAARSKDVLRAVVRQQEVMIIVSPSWPT